jgi:sec-independent protein translocase protein TatA
MDMLAIGPVGLPEGGFILLIILLLFGAKRLPDIGKGLGKGVKEFREGIKGMGEDDDAEKPAPKTPEKPAE